LHTDPSTRKKIPKFTFQIRNHQNVPWAVVEDGGELHLDAGADHEQHHDEEGVEVEERRLKSRQQTRIRFPDPSNQQKRGERG
jgi:hypothetical protein